MFPWALLLLLGATWGLSVSLIKILINAGYSPFGVLFFEYWFAVLALGAIALYRRMPLIAPLREHFLPLAFMAIICGLVPAMLLYYAAVHVQAGVIAITIALVPMGAYGISLALGIEKFRSIRIAGLALGFLAMMLIILPGNSLPESTPVAWILVLCVVVGLTAMAGVMSDFAFAHALGPVRLALGGSIIGTLTLLPIAIARQDFVMPGIPPEGVAPGRYDFILLGLATLITFSDIIFIRVVQRHGPVFANQAGYAVTIAGVLWGIALFGETHSAWIWAALVLVLCGMMLVAPKEQENPIEPMPRA